MIGRSSSPSAPLVDAPALLTVLSRLEGGREGGGDSAAPRPMSEPEQPPRLGLVALGVLGWLLALTALDWGACLLAAALDLPP